jgi:peptide-O-fucosyltransferase
MGVLYLLFKAVLLLTLYGILDADTSADERPGGPYVYHDTRPAKMGHVPIWDPNGYVLFCLCMGRMGNQIDHLLGGMAFAEALNRTLILPPFRTYRNVRFTEWFRFEPIASHQKAVLAEDFMEYLAPTYWPPGKRLGFCWLPPDTTQTDCKMKEGNPFGPFWDGLGVDFDGSIVYHLSYHTHDLPEWNKRYPPSKYPILAFRGAPASFPVQRQHRELQRHLVFSSRIQDEAHKYIETHFDGQKFVGLHLRNGADWANACKGAQGVRSYMSSLQCLETTSGLITSDLCYPPTSEVLRLTKHVVTLSKAKIVFVATDQNPLIEEIEQHLKNEKVKVYHADPWVPLIDWAILIRSDHFIGNCVSSFTAFVKRARDLEGKPTYFWGFD